MKKVVKFKFEDKEGFLSVVEKNQHYYSLVQKDTPKVEDILKHHRLKISYELKNPEYQEVEANIILDQELATWVYKKLEEDKNLYFKEFNESLCVLEIPLV